MNTQMKVIIGVLIIALVGALLTLSSREAVTPEIEAPTASTSTTTTNSPSEPSDETEPVRPSGITTEIVAEHNSAASCYSIIDGKVYDLTAWINSHPGGERAILSICGTDGTAAFESQHGSSGAPQSRLDSFYIGDLAR